VLLYRAAPCCTVQAVFVAAKDKMDLSIAVALGSSTQVAIFIVPVTVSFSAVLWGRNG
jgi:calcium/proton exchanger cax